jgi:hydroxyethylthiazole kinase-like uncharacterized protein yjeF
MSDYDYLNARVRGMSTALLPREFYEQVLTAFSESILLDALLGYNSKGAPREPLAGIIRRANSSGVPVLAVDVPSGLDPTSGEPRDPCIAAKATVTLALPKTGFLNPASRRFVGELYLGDVSIPAKVYADFQQTEPLFQQGQIVKIW